MRGNLSLRASFCYAKASQNGHKNCPRAGTAHMGKTSWAALLPIFMVGRLPMKFYGGFVSGKLPLWTLLYGETAAETAVDSFHNVIFIPIIQFVFQFPPREAAAFPWASDILPAVPSAR